MQRNEKHICKISGLSSYQQYDMIFFVVLGQPCISFDSDAIFKPYML